MHLGHITEHDEKYLRNLDCSVRKFRSPFRLDKEIDFDCHFAIEMPDLCFVPNSKDLPTFSVEIKPKSGLVPNWNQGFVKGVCKFCMSQHYKLAIGKWCSLLLTYFSKMYFLKHDKKNDKR